jgi:hypothetical protein
MGLNNIQLPASLVADFYKRHLVEPIAGVVMSAAKSGSADAATKTSLPYLGKNQQNIVVLVSYPKEAYLPDEQLNFLTSILQACRLNLGDVAIVNQAKQAVTFELLRDTLDCQRLLVFGVEAPAIGLPATALFSEYLQDNCTILCSPAIEELNSQAAESKALKTRLWGCLKKIFNV